MEKTRKVAVNILLFSISIFNDVIFNIMATHRMTPIHPISTLNFFAPFSASMTVTLVQVCNLDSSFNQFATDYAVKNCVRFGHKSQTCANCKVPTLGTIGELLGRFS